ncbi:antitoxin MazE-like protein [Caldovatus aquaticus]|uniref:antitoxin MazE-like protein n=1 Tax=Caldovatus aquaticus TaxID=2865671 RepID=UPI0038D01DCB
MPDTRAPGFAEEARRQSRLVDADRAEFDDVMGFIERHSAWPEEHTDIPAYDAPR